MNILSVQYGDGVYFITLRALAEGEELLSECIRRRARTYTFAAWYGGEYGRELLDKHKRRALPRHPFVR
jgi:hypothetical protein